jgi:hypothetical protein
LKSYHFPPSIAAREDSRATLNLTKRYRDQGNMGTWAFLEADMSALFSIAFAGIFLIFIVAAIVGHILLVDALIRPFFLGGLANSPMMVSSSALPRPIH